jgi:hypothetical protein
MTMRKTLLSLLLLLPATTWATFNAYLQQESITEGETAELVLEIRGQSSAVPDTTPLLESFEILGNSRSSQVNIINGQMSAQTRWILTLSPKQPGRLTIPPLELDGEQSAPLTLTVKPAEVATAASGAPLFIESSVDLRTPYLQQMVHYRVQLFYRAKLAEGRLSDPEIDNVLIQQLGEDREFTTKRNGVGYRVVERNYALFPQQSGSITIPAPVLDARIVVAASQGRSGSPLNDLFNGSRLNTTRALRIRGNAEELEVRPRPPAHQHEPWLPAKALQLNEQWQPDQDEIRVGEPLSRTLSIEAEGLIGTMLPDLEPAASAGFKLYPEPASQESQSTREGVVGRKVRKIAYIPTQAGQFTLPPLELKWWNSRENRMELAQLPARTLTVLPAVASSPQPQPAVQQRLQAQPPSPASLPAAQPAGTPASAAPTTRQPTLWLWTTVLFALLWLLSLLLWWRNRGRFTAAATPPADAAVPKSCDRYRKAFLQGCRDNDPQQARSALLQWTACHWPDNPPRGLDGVAQRLDNPMVAELLTALDRALYQQTLHHWDGAPLQQHLSQLPATQRPEGEETLQPLYPR